MNVYYNFDGLLNPPRRETLRISAPAALKIQPSQKKHNYNLFATLLIPCFNIGTLKLISNPSLH